MITAQLSVACRMVKQERAWYLSHVSAERMVEWENSEPASNLPVSNSLPSVYLTSLHMTRSSRPFPSVFAYCKQSETGDSDSLEAVKAWERFQTRLI